MGFSLRLRSETGHQIKPTIQFQIIFQ